MLLLLLLWEISHIGLRFYACCTRPHYDDHYMYNNHILLPSVGKMIHMTTLLQRGILNIPFLLALDEFAVYIYIYIYELELKCEHREKEKH